mmetsp:Transcript_26949/g.53064  ORF Transcript_26949/g.53064 Transcript_26949/m.53064 type:complete len:343 (+) Transcript_26949:44-1072(+)
MPKDRKTFSERINVQSWAWDRLKLPVASLVSYLLTLFHPAFSWILVVGAATWVAWEMVLMKVEYDRLVFEQFLIEVLDDLSIKSNKTQRDAMKSVYDLNKFLRDREVDIKFTESEWPRYFAGRNKMFRRLRDLLNSSEVLQDLYKMADAGELENITSHLTKMKARRKNIYTPVNNGKKYLSIDVKTANWTFLRHFFPNAVGKKYAMFGDARDWGDFVVAHMDSFPKQDLIPKSKLMRQKILGSARKQHGAPLLCTLSAPLVNDIILAVAHELKDLVLPSLVSAGGDEILVELENFDDQVKIEKRVQEGLEKLFPFMSDRFHIEFFQLEFLQQLKESSKENVP